MTVSILRRTGAAGLTLLIAGCVAPVTTAPPVGPGAPPAFSIVGLESVMGRNARALESAFGKPDLDVREGSARKLQYSGPACVLDAYLYPPTRGGNPVVTYVDARLPGGGDFDRASCVAALTAQRQTR